MKKQEQRTALVRIKNDSYDDDDDDDDGDDDSYYYYYYYYRKYLPISNSEHTNRKKWILNFSTESLRWI